MALLEIELPEALLPQPKQIGQFIRRTQSVCPECNRILPATVFAREGKVFMTKTCPEHGETEELYFGSYDMYQKFATYWSDQRNPCSKRPNRELRMPSQLWSMLKPPQPYWTSKHNSYQPV